MGVRRLTVISQAFAYVALAAWIITCWGLISRLVSIMIRPGASRSSQDRSG